MCLDIRIGMTIYITNLQDVRIIARGPSPSPSRRCITTRKRGKKYKGGRGSCINSTPRGILLSLRSVRCPHTRGRGCRNEPNRMKSEREKERETQSTDEERTARVNFCVISLFLCLLLLLSPFFTPLVPHGPRFKYQRRLKSDLYHAESCYLYRFIGDLLARYSEGESLV